MLRWSTAQQQTNRHWGKEHKRLVTMWCRENWFWFESWRFIILLIRIKSACAKFNEGSVITVWWCHEWHWSQGSVLSSRAKVSIYDFQGIWRHGSSEKKINKLHILIYWQLECWQKPFDATRLAFFWEAARLVVRLHPPLLKPPPGALLCFF